MTTINDFKKRIELLNDDYMLFTSSKNPATKELISQYEQERGLVFSDDIKEFLQTYGCLILEVNEKIWPRPAENSVLPLWEFGYGFFIFGLSTNPNMPNWLTYDENFKDTMTYGNITNGQMFFKKSGNLYRAYTNNGTILIEYELGGETEIFPGNIYDFLITEIENLNDDYNKYIAKSDL